MENAMRAESTEPEKWYKQFWPWFIISLLGSVVCASLFTLTIAFKHADRPVEGDYYRQGLATEKSHVAELAAGNFKLSADLAVTDDALSLTWLNAETALPDSLTLHILHPFDHKLDTHTTLLKNEQGAYIGSLDKQSSGRRYFVLEDPEHTWKMKSTSTELSAQMLVQFGHAGRD